MKISILGSTGFLGKVLLKKALEAGYEIKTLARNPEKLGEFKDKVEFIQGNIFKADDIDRATSGTKAVLSAVGPPQKNTEDPQKYKKAMEDLVAILEKKNIKRLIHTGGAVHPGGDKENWSTGRRLLWCFLNIFAKPILEAKHLEWEVLKKSNIDWTLVRPPKIIKGELKNKKVIADEKNLASTKINVEDLAGFMLDQIVSEDWIKKAPLVSSGK